jgi:hypothetical protein
MFYLDEWYDLLRVGMFLLSLGCTVTLLLKWRRYSESQSWTSKTKDYWYSMFMWSIVGQVTSIQSIYLDRPLTPATVTILAAVLVTVNGLRKKGTWGGKDA